MTCFSFFKMRDTIHLFSLNEEALLEVVPDSVRMASLPEMPAEGRARVAGALSNRADLHARFSVKHCECVIARDAIIIAVLPLAQPSAAAQEQHFQSRTE